MGSLKSLSMTFYWSSIETIALDCFVFEKIAFLYAVLRQMKKNRRRQSVIALATLWVV